MSTRTTPWVSVLLASLVLAACGGGGSSAPPDSLLRANTGTLALAVSGKARELTLTNPTSKPLDGLQIHAGALPAGTTVASNCGASLAGGASCTLTVTPGATPLPAPGDAQSSPPLLVVTANGSAPLNIGVRVIAHGSVYQGGHVFSIDDTTPASVGIGGKVLGLSDLGLAPWSPVADDIPGTGPTATAGTNSCDGAIDGACDTALIVAHHGAQPTPYAAALCSDSQAAGFDNWYLPAICEMFPNANGIAACGTPGQPVPADNVYDRLYSNGNVAGLSTAQAYSSATQSAPGTAYGVAYGQDNWGTAGKGTNSLVRCARTLTP
jgi:hypothetical protein